MDADVIKGKWNQLKGTIKREWGELTDDELTQIDGDADRLSGKLQERYGWAKTDAEERMNDFFRRNP